MLRDIINRNVVCVDRNATLLDVSIRMAEQDVGCVVVVNEDQSPCGIVTDRDIVVRGVASGKDFDDLRCDDVMSQSVTTCHETDGIFDCIEKMRDAKVRRLPVVDSNGKVISVVSFGDILAVLGKELHELTVTTTPAEELDQRAA